ncbi:MAG: FAD binding domain-containing protein [Xanthobacteraceae bacterium]
MKPAPFAYIAARSLEEALSAKADYGDEGMFLAGGQSLMPAINFRLAQPAILIDINALQDLDGVRDETNGMCIGAMTRYRTLERNTALRREQPLVSEAIPQIGHPQIRNRGTLGGSLANADPASELPAVMLALGARMRAQSLRGERWIEADDFFVGALTTSLAADEILAEVEIPRAPPRTGTCFMEVARRLGDFALMGVAATLTLDQDGRCTDARLAFCSAGDRPVRAEDASRSLKGMRPADAEIRQAAALAQAAIDPAGNVHASKQYQRHLAGVLTRRALRTAAQRALGALGTMVEQQASSHVQ